MRRTAAGIPVVVGLALVAALTAPTAQAGPATTRAATRAEAAVAKLVVTPASRKVAYGTGWQLKATARSSNGTTTNVSATARWRSTKARLARVSATGLVTATKRKRSGTVTIRAAYGGKVASSKIVVSSARLRSITGTPASTTLAVGQSFVLQPVGRFVGFSQALRQWSTYTTAPTGIVSVSGGTVTALAPGTTVVRTTFRGKAVSTRVTVTAPVTAPVPTTPEPAVVSRLTLAATTGTFADTDADSILDMGDVLPWTFTVTNTGGTTLSSVSVTPTLDGPATCPAGTLAPGASFTCSAEHTVTQDDVAAGSVSNQATASATGPAGPVTAPGPVAVTTPFDRMNIALEHSLPNLVTYAELVAEAKERNAAHTSLGQVLLPETPMTWNPDDTGKGIVNYAAPYQQVVLTSNKNYDSAGSSTMPIALVGTTPTGSTRLGYVSANPFRSDTDPGTPATFATTTDPGMNAFNTNLLSWLLGGTNMTTSQAKVAIVNMSGTPTGSGAELQTRNWLSTHAPSVQPNTTNCDLPTGIACLTGVDLIIFGGSGSEADRAAIAGQVKAAYDAGTPVLFMANGWNGNAPDSIAEKFGMSIDYYQSYFDETGLLNSTKEVQLPGGLDALQQVVSPLITTTFDSPLATSDYMPCITDQMADSLASRPFTSCSLGTAAFQSYRNAVNAWRSMITNVDKAGLPWFSMPRSNDMDLYRALLLAADKLRTGAAPSLRPGDTATAVSYPVPTLTDGAALTRALFVDATTMTAWTGNQAAANTGTLYCTRTNLIANACTAPTWPELGAHSLTLKATGGDEWQATGLDAVPGSPVTVSLTSDPGVAVYVRTFYQRSAGTRSTFKDGADRSLYDRPQFAATDWVPVTTTPRQISSPYGGPLYIRIVGNAAALGDDVSLAFGNASTHPAVLDMTDSSQIQDFVNSIGSGAYYADLAGNGFQAHMPVPYITRALTETNSNGRKVLYANHGGLQQFLEDFRDQYVFSIYRMAGLQVGTQPLTETLDPDVKTICGNLGFPCLNSALNQRTQIQHVNYDLNAVCGSLCSGNPIDSSSPPVPFGWGESHELGHNLQRPQLSIFWPNTGTNGSIPAAVDTWTNYANRSGEVSNNIFPYHTAWNFFRVVHPGWGSTPEGAAPDTADLNRNVGGVDAFSIAQSIRSAQLSSGHLAAYDSSCVSHTTDDATTPTNIAIANAIWRRSGTYDDNELRMSFYQQIPVLLRGRTMSDGTTLNDGFGIWTLLYQAARGWSDATSSQARWTAEAQATYGMTSFPWNGLDAVYGSGRTVASMIGNDWLLIMLSKVTGYDWRPYFQMHGVLYTGRADQQVTANAPTGGYRSFSMTFPALGAQLPFKDMSNIGTVDMTLPTTAWPGAYESSPTTLSKAGFHPLSCPLLP